LNDEERAQEWKNEYDSEMQEDYEEYDSCEELYGNDKEDDSEDESESDQDIFIESNATGEITFGTLPDDQIEILKSLHRSKDFIDTDLIGSYGYLDYDDLGHSYGVTGDVDSADFLNTDMENSSVIFEEIHDICLPTADEDYKDGFYICHTSLSEANLNFTIEIEESNSFDPNKLKIEYINIDLDIINTNKYGELYGTVYQNYYYNDKQIAEDEMLVERDFYYSNTQ